MGLKARRVNSPHGKYSKTMIIPAALKAGKESTIAANRLMLVDPRGEIPEDDLLEFLEEHVEPVFWPWLKEKEAQPEP